MTTNFEQERADAYRRFANLPKPGQVLTAREILALDLPDSPSFNFKTAGRRGVIQTSHVTREAQLKVPWFADSLWRYKYTTKEWIPVFEFAGCKEVLLLKFLDLEIERDPFWNDDQGPKGWWATLKGHPRRQPDW